MRYPALFVLVAACTQPAAVEPPSTPVLSPSVLTEHCKQFVPRVIEVTPNVFVATGYDLANVVLIKTDAGNVIVDAGMSPARALPMKQALAEKAPGETAALVYTHSHIDHVGGAKVWLDDDTEIWATEPFSDHFLKQYSLFRDVEMRRGQRQFGTHVSQAALACSAIGPRPDVEGARETGARLPTHSFTDSHTLKIGSTTIELVAAPGETHDQLFVWLPDERVLLAGDNFYSTFPNLYTIRGTKPRPVDSWIASLDEMRRLAPEHLVPGHTSPISGTADVARALMVYRDGIQFVRDETVRRATAGQDPSQVQLPASLASEQILQPLYGQPDWSARAIYANQLGWFDGSAADLYPLSRSETARREVEAMGGEQEVLRRARDARDSGELRWAAHLLSKLEASEAVTSERAAVYEALAETVANTNGRAYLLESAYEARGGATPPSPPVMDDELLAAVPLELIFEQMAVRLDPQAAANIHESVRFVFPEENLSVTVTVRNGIAEVVVGDPLPGTPPPIATATVDAMTWRKLAVGQMTRIKAITSGKLDVPTKQLGAFRKFMGRFAVD